MLQGESSKTLTALIAASQARVASEQKVQLIKEAKNCIEGKNMLQRNIFPTLKNAWCNIPLFIYLWLYYKMFDFEKMVRELQIMIVKILFEKVWKYINAIVP